MGEKKAWSTIQQIHVHLQSFIFKISIEAWLKLPFRVKKNLIIQHSSFKIRIPEKQFRRNLLEDATIQYSNYNRPRLKKTSWSTIVTQSIETHRRNKINWENVSSNQRINAANNFLRNGYDVTDRNKKENVPQQS